ncbi:TonB-dependent siderophore receptor [uncultured Dechloromonas sp.]|uniref:TonB-dependent receptor family protein n=1 Tax=uncultured Dechloromonas sp. TaxID=171719 RepID=UPI0025D8F335|nr:TonB-dependent siderophore receptor [uncultured Dechloromonas sp.]
MKSCLSRKTLSPTPLVLAIAAAYACLPAAHAKESAPEKTLATVKVIGGEENLPTLGGAGQILGKKELEDAHVFTVNEALRKVPGVHARDEEGFGLRPNIAMRGLNPTRSTKITLLEDGLPLAYAPYGDNASYYHPMVDRYERIEVLKGASSLMFGPQTVGGVVNYITPAPRQNFGGYVQGVVGSRDFFNGKVNVGGGGLTLDYGHKQGDGARDNMNHKLDDFNVKYGAMLGDRNAITLRANFYKEDSTLTYSGLTQAEYDRQGARYNPFKNDRFEAERTGLSATHDFLIDDKSTLTTSLYYSKFDRDWWRQASNSQDAQCAALNPSRLAGVAINPDACNSTQGRLRSYETWGIEPRLTVAHGLGEFQAGVRAHFEEQDRKQVNGTSPMARSGTLVESNLRKTSAYSGFIANRFDIGQFSVTPIARYESIKAERTNRLTGQSGESSVHAFTPGIGATWNPTRTLTVFTSLHKGFAPPRVEDLIGGTGTVVDVDYEKSLNFEFGVRSQPLQGVSVQAAYFRNDYDNLIAVGSIAGGSTPLSQGKALFEGLELAANAELSNGVFGRMAYTWLPTAEQTEAFRNVANGAVVGVQGKRQAYAPEHTLTAALGYGIGPFRGEVEAQYVGSQYSDFANTVAPTADGQKGEIAAYTVWNAALNYRFDKSLSAFITGKNVFDKTYIVDRTRGIQVGMPRLIQVGVKYAF